MEKLIERLARPATRRDDVTESSASETGASSRVTTSVGTGFDIAAGGEQDQGGLFGLFQLWPLKSEGFEVDETQIE